MSCPLECEQKTLLGGAGLLVIGLGLTACNACIVTSTIFIVAGAAALGYWFGQNGQKSGGKVNSKVQLDSDKVVDNMDMEDLGDKAVLCRCWKSEKFPYCDGSHNKHNKVTGDNVGPLIIKKKDA